MGTHAEAVRGHNLTMKQAKAILRTLDGPVAGALLRALAKGDLQSVIDVEFPNPSLYASAQEFASDYQAYSLLRKYSAFSLGLDTKQLALDKFLESEAACKLTNQTNVSPYRPLSTGLTPESYISYARNIIAKTLGSFCWNAAAERFRFSGGASTRLPRRAGHPFYKYQGKPDVTRNCALLAAAAVKSIPLWHQQMTSEFGAEPRDWFNIVDGNRVTTVPKTAKIDRMIAIEPDMNMYIQLGIGSLIRSRLKSVHIDLNDQTVNQRLARIGSSTGSLSTIDLASASDSIALSLVELLLPPDWYKAICLTRSEYGVLPNGVKHRYEKVSSMGNGFTFELESLIFWALAKAVLDLNEVEDRRLGVYGDDIVIHNSVASTLIDCLWYCGFSTNTDKTFVSGPFRESCGKHYYYGDDVTPLSIKRPLDHLGRQFWLINRFREWTSFRSSPQAYQSVYDYLVDSVPRHRRYTVPVSYGDESGIWASFDECTPYYHPWKQAYSIKLLRSRRRRHTPSGVPALIVSLSSLEGSESRPTLWEGGNPSKALQLEKGSDVYVHSRAYISWWDVAPRGVVFKGTKLINPIN